MVKATDWDSLVRATAFRRPACSAPSRQNCTPLPCRLLSPGHTYCRLLPFPTRPSIPVLAVPSFSDANTMSNRIHPSDASRGGRARNPSSRGAGASRGTEAWRAATAHMGGTASAATRTGGTTSGGEARARGTASGGGAHGRRHERPRRRAREDSPAARGVKHQQQPWQRQQAHRARGGADEDGRRSDG